MPGPHVPGGRQLIAGCLLRVGDRVLLSRRATSPRAGCWTIPGGFVEPGESAQQGALRELDEEAGVKVPEARLTAVYEMPQIGQLLLLFTASVRRCTFRAGPESSEVALFDTGHVPWNELAFATDRRTLFRFQHDAVRDTIEFGQLYWGDDGRIRLSAHIVEFLIEDAMYA